MRTIELFEGIEVQKPGHYKKMKQFSAGRKCSCGKQISIYNSSDFCFSCLNNNLKQIGEIVNGKELS